MDIRISDMYLDRIFYEYGQFRAKRARTHSNLWSASPLLRAQQ